MLNFETVKYFDGTAHEEAAYDAKLQACRDAALRTQYSLAMLNFGQNLIFSAGFSASLLLVANEVVAGRTYPNPNPSPNPTSTPTLTPTLTPTPTLTLTATLTPTLTLTLTRPWPVA